MTTRVEITGRGGDFTVLHIYANNRDYMFTGKIANDIIDSMERELKGRTEKHDKRQLDLNLPIPSGRE